MKFSDFSKEMADARLGPWGFANGVPVYPIARGDFCGRLRSGYGRYSPARQFRERGSLTEEFLPLPGKVSVAVDLVYFRVRTKRLVGEFEICQKQFMEELRLHGSLCKVGGCDRIVPLYGLLKDMSELISKYNIEHASLVETMKCLF